MLPSTGSSALPPNPRTSRWWAEHPFQADLFRQLVHSGWTLIRLERYRAGHRRAYSRLLTEITKLQTKAMLWITTHSGVQAVAQNGFPIANPAVRALDAETSSRLADWRSAPREE